MRIDEMRLHQLKMNRFVLSALGVFAMAAIMTVRAMSAAAAGSAFAELRVYFIDVEGGQSTLFITPSGESLLIDSGWPGNNYRDANRIASVAKQAGVRRIDYVLITHYHDDHVGGVPQLVDRIAVGTFIDHGPNRELDHGKTEGGYAAYQAVLASGKAKPGARRPVCSPAKSAAAQSSRGVNVRMVGIRIAPSILAEILGMARAPRPVP
jgi:beta-lactamase superfamily II metal-dependent hydrolase